MPDDFYRYSPYGYNCYVIEGRDGSLLIGDQLPTSEQEARLLCRCANIAYKHGVTQTKKDLYANIIGLMS